MWAVIIIMISFLYTLGDTNNECSSLHCENSFNQTCHTLMWSYYTNCANVNLNHKNIMHVNVTEILNYDTLIRLDMSDNQIRNFSEGFLSKAKALKEINLSNNLLTHLPKMFLANSSSLQVVNLEGNNLSEIPASVLHFGLVNLTVDCNCNVANSINMHLNQNNTYPKLTITCKMSSSWSSLSDFYDTNCVMPRLLALYIILPIVLLGLIIGGVALYMRNRTRKLATFESKATTDQSLASGQPRYMSRNPEGIATTFNQGQTQEYENVFVGQFPHEVKPYDYMEDTRQGGHSNTLATEEDIYLESDVNEGDQPIYSNTQGVYYDYTDSSGINKYKEDDDVYILPDD